jgi:hypothetical protein
MSTEGYTTRLEQAMAEHADTLKIFKTAQKWKHQVSVNDAGGVEGFQKFAPFAFASFKPPTDSNREGDGDLNQRLRFGIMIGQYSKEVGQARIDVSFFRDSIIDAFDSWHPEGFDCDELKYLDEIEEVDDGHNYALTLLFITSKITNKNTL